MARYNIPEGCENLLKGFEDGMTKDRAIVEKGETVVVYPCDRTNDFEFFYLNPDSDDEWGDTENEGLHNRQNKIKKEVADMVRVGES